MHLSFFIERVIDVLFPPHVDVVQARNVSLDMLRHIFHLRFDEMFRIYTGLPYTDEAVRVLIRANKYHRDPHAATLLGYILNNMIDTVQKEYALEHAQEKLLLMTVPPSPKRLRERGYNQVARILERMPRLNQWERCDALKRHHRKSQTQVQKSARRENIRGAFYVPQGSEKLVRGRSILLVDDVCESGSTMKDATRALREAGAVDVTCLALAR